MHLDCSKCYSISWSAQAAKTKYYRLGGFNNNNLFISVLETRILRSGYQHGWVLVKAVFLACRWLHFHCVLTWWREKEHKYALCCLLYSYKDTNCIMKAPPSWPHLNLITSQRPHLHISSRWWLGFQHTNLRRT